MNASTAQLVRKEIRSLTLLYAAVVVLITVAAAALFLNSQPVYVVAAVCVEALAGLAGAATFAGEKGKGTIHFLAALPIERTCLFRIKTLHTAAVPAAVTLAVVVLSFLKARTVPAHQVLPFFCYVLSLLSYSAWLYCFGLLFSLLMDTVIIATLAGVATACVAAVPVIILFTYAFNNFEAAHVAEPLANANALGFPLSGALYLSAALLLTLAIPIAAVWLARRLFCGRFRPARDAE